VCSLSLLAQDNNYKNRHSPFIWYPLNGQHGQDRQEDLLLQQGRSRAAEWRAFRPKLLAMAGGKSCRRAMIMNKSDKDVNKDDTKEELTAAYKLIMLTVR
jgi:hypothetical protein